MFIFWGLKFFSVLSSWEFNYDFFFFFLSEGSRWHDSQQFWFSFILVTFSINSHTFVSLVQSGTPTISTHSRHSFLQHCFSKLVMHFTKAFFIVFEICNRDSILSKVFLTSASWFVKLATLLFSLSSLSTKGEWY